jgi:pyruvate/2-oxoglutarate dehydrogenase complex dihydrolipoamide dehydrogenase (E3) component
VRAGKVSFDFVKVMARKNLMIKDFAYFRAQQLNAGKFKFIRANASFLDRHTVELTTPHPPSGHPLPIGRGEGRARNLVARHFVIATGSSVSPSPLPQLHEVGFITSDDAVALKRLPKSIIVLGGGAIACEFAQFFQRFGVKVTLVQRSGNILKEFDADAGKEIEIVFRREGMRVFTGTKLLAAGRKGRLKTVTFEQDGRRVSVSAEEILFALGRVPNTASLKPDASSPTTKCRRARRTFSRRETAPGRTKSSMSPSSRARRRFTTWRSRNRRAGWIIGS